MQCQASSRDRNLLQKIVLGSVREVQFETQSLNLIMSRPVGSGYKIVG